MVIWASIFVHIETIMFGGNWYPKSISELICDGIGMAVCFCGIYFIITKNPAK